MVEIKKDKNIQEIVKEHPETFEVFQKHGLSCIGCPFAGVETLEQGAKSHGIEVEELIKELKEAIEKSEE